MDLTLQELISQTGDSTLHSYNFSNGVLVVSLELDDDRNVTLKIPTTTVKGKQFPVGGNRYKIDRNCYLKLDELKSILKVNENGFYVPSSDFGQMMKEIRCGASLAYGSRVTEINWLLRFIGYSPTLVVCTVSDINQIIFTVEE